MKKIVQGLKENRQQFFLLVIVNAFVGGMVGMERTIFPKFAEQSFDVASKTAVLTFIAAFGLTKALTNYLTGRLANRFGRRNLLLAGWLLAIPVPLLLIWAPAWIWVVAANVLLGMSQGLAWSSTVVMKIDLVGEKNRGLAMGLNEFAGYLSVGIVAWLTGRMAENLGVTPYPFYLGLGLAVTGLLLTLFLVKDTRAFVHHETATAVSAAPLGHVFKETTLKNKTLSSVTQAGLINNLNDGMVWGLLPMLLASWQMSTDQTGIVTAVYPAVWGLGQLFTGLMADRYSRKGMLFWGMLLQALAIFILPFAPYLIWQVLISALLGLGTALVYPTFMVVIAAETSPAQRAESLGVFRLWRDLGYAVGAILSGITADLFGMTAAILLIAGLTLISALIVRFRMPGKSISANHCVSPDELMKELKSGDNLYLMDVRSKEEFESGHIPEALNIPLPELPEKMIFLEKDTRIITACAKGGGRSEKAAGMLRQMGFREHRLCGGIEGMQLS